MVGENEDEVMLTITNSSSLVQYKNEKVHNELLKTMNATVNHEIRNPLNSIDAYNQLNFKCYKELKELMENENLTVQKLKAEFKSIMSKLKESNEIQSASTKMIKFLVQDMLDYSQIN